MNSKFKNFTELINSIDEEIQRRRLEREWYKFRIEKIASRTSQSN